MLCVCSPVNSEHRIPVEYNINKPTSFSRFIADRVKWDETDPVARVIISFAVAADGSVEVKDILEATDRRLLRRIQKALDEAPKWIPALKDGEGVATDHVLRITLPKGRQLPRERVVLIR